MYIYIYIQEQTRREIPRIASLDPVISKTLGKIHTPYFYDAILILIPIKTER